MRFFPNKRKFLLAYPATFPKKQLGCAGVSGFFGLVALLLPAARTILATTADPSVALQADQVLVVVNTRMAGARAVARYYMRERGIPKGNLLEIILFLDDTISHQNYNDLIVKKVRKKLEKLASQSIAALVSFYGMPLKIAQTP